MEGLRHGGGDAQPKHSPKSVRILENRPMPSVLLLENQPMRSRITLNDHRAAEIYQCKIELLQTFAPFRAPSALLKGQSMRISYMFDVSPKTIRDVWNRLTWQSATRHLWTKEDVGDFNGGIQRIVQVRRRDQVDRSATVTV